MDVNVNVNPGFLRTGRTSERFAREEQCVYTDASDKFWAQELKKATTEQHHEPLAFLSGEFK